MRTFVEHQYNIFFESLFAREAYIHSKVWNIVFFPYINGNVSLYFNRRTAKGENQLKKMQLCISTKLEKIMYFEMVFFLKLPERFKNKGGVVIGCFDNSVLVKYSSEKLHENRIFFEKELLGYSVPQKALKIVNKFLELDDHFKKMEKERLSKLLCGFFRHNTEKRIIPGIQKIIQEKVVGAEANTESEPPNFRQ